MIDFHSSIYKALSAIKPTYYEMTLTHGIKTPCISYMEISNTATDEGDTLGYSRIQYQIKVWGHDIEELQAIALQIDLTLRLLGGKRVSTNEMYDRNSTMIQKILGYEFHAIENY